jgi:tRNA nucleotidyltransferase/poly(A) polymerase
MIRPSLTDAAFLRAPGVVAIFTALGGSETRIVGGAVRDALLGRAVGEIDFATRMPPDAVIAAVEAAGLKAVPTGLAHGTVTVVAHGAGYEVTTLRRDVETDGRRAVVAFTEDWEEDAARRDFTMNALYCAADGTVFDPAGGYEDLRAGRVRFIGSAEERIREDYLRILRFFRFFAWFGSGRPDADGLRAVARLKAGMTVLSAERVWRELKRLLAAPDPARALLWMRTTEVLQTALPESWGIDALPRLLAAEPELGIDPDPMLRLEAILPPRRSRIEELAARLRLSGAERDRLLAWADAPEADPDLTEADLRKRLYRSGAAGAHDRIVHAFAREHEAGKAAVAGHLRKQRDVVLGWQKPRFPVSGDDLARQGMSAGPAMGERLRELEDRWVESGFALSREELLG